MRGGPTFDHEKVSFNLAKLKKFGENFEIAVDPDLAIEYKEGGEVAVEEIVKAEKVFADTKKGLLASEEAMQKVFETTDPLKIAEHILKNGEIQLTAEHRARIREDKQKRLIEHIRRNAIDPKTKLPHPATRIELAFAEAKVHVDETKSIDAQVKDVVKLLQPILPLRFEMATMRVHLPAESAGKCYGDVKNMGTLKKEEWLNDGTWVGYVEIPAGMQNDFIDMLNAKTHGNVSYEKFEDK